MNTERKKSDHNLHISPHIYEKKLVTYRIESTEMSIATSELTQLNNLSATPTNNSISLNNAEWFVVFPFFSIFYFYIRDMSKYSIYQILFHLTHMHVYAGFAIRCV